MSGAVKFSRLDEETLSYFREVETHFKDLEDNGEEKEILVNNVFEEVNGRESEIVCDAACSRVVETLLPHASKALLKEFARKCIEGDNLGIICTSGPFGSHVLETLLDVVMQKIAFDVDENGLLQDILQEFADVSSGCLLEMITSRYGSFVARRLVGALGGEIYDAKKMKKMSETDTQSRSYSNCAKNTLARRMMQGEQASKDGAKTLYVEPRLDLLEKICQVFLSDDVGPKDIHDLQTDTHAGPFLKYLLEIMGRVAQEQQRDALVICLLGGNPAVGPDSVSSDALYQLMTDKGGSHIVEAAFVAASDFLFSKLCTLGFKGRLPALAQHPVANFPVQAAIANVKKSQQLKRMFEDLKDQFGGLLKGRRGGVVTVMLAATSRLGVLQEEISEALWNSLNSSFSGNAYKTPFHALLVLDTSTVLGTRQKGKLSPLGCSALVTLFGFPKKMSKVWNQALEALSSDELVDIALDAGGCRVLEAYLLHHDTSSKRSSHILTNLQGHWADIALFGSGNRFVETCYGIAGPREKKDIAKSLAGAETKISATYRGPVLLQRCGVDTIKQSEDVFEKKIQSIEATKKEFENLFGTSEDIGEEGHAPKKDQVDIHEDPLVATDDGVSDMILKAGVDNKNKREKLEEEKKKKKKEKKSKKEGERKKKEEGERKKKKEKRKEVPISEEPKKKRKNK